MRACFLVLACSLAVPAMAQPYSGDVASGAAIARTWCINCHVIDARATTAGDNVPSFPAIARRPATTSLSLQTFLLMPHGRMPNFQLSAQGTWAHAYPLHSGTI